jgi:hypothetical protein
MGGCPLEEVQRRIDQLLPPDCGWPSPAAVTAKQ